MCNACGLYYKLHNVSRSVQWLVTGKLLCVLFDMISLKVRVLRLRVMYISVFKSKLFTFQANFNLVSISPQPIRVWYIEGKLQAFIWPHLPGSAQTSSYLFFILFISLTLTSGSSLSFVSGHRLHLCINLAQCQSPSHSPDLPGFVSLEFHAEFGRPSEIWRIRKIGRCSGANGEARLVIWWLVIPR